jgi:hypothetical protein
MPQKARLPYQKTNCVGKIKRRKLPLASNASNGVESREIPLISPCLNPLHPLECKASAWKHIPQMLLPARKQLHVPRPHEQSFAAPHCSISPGVRPEIHPQPGHSSAAEDIAPLLDCIKWDIGLKTYFSGRDKGKYSKLRTKSIWRPPLPPRDIDLWVTSFLKQLSGYFFGVEGRRISHHGNINCLSPCARIHPCS